MAITLIGNPLFSVVPAYNPIKYYYDSTNKNQEGFRYVIDVYEGGTANKIWEGRGFPLPVNGYCEVDLQPIVSPKVSWEDSPLTDTNNALKSYFKFDIKIGEEFIVAWAYTGYLQYTGGGTWNNYTMLRQSPATSVHTYAVGDQIEVKQTDGGIIKPMLEGLFTVVAVPDAYSVVIDIPFVNVGVGAAMGGTIKYADNRKTIGRDLNTQSRTAYNGALSPLDFITLPTGVFYVSTTGTTQSLLTEIPTEGMLVTVNQDLAVNIGNFYLQIPRYVYFQNDAGDIYRKTTSPLTTAAIIKAGVGVNNLGAIALVSGTAPLIKTNTKYYDFWVANSVGVQCSKKYRIEIDRRCEINTTELCFLDRLGGFASFAFQAQQTQNFKVEKGTFKKQLGGLSSGAWRYTLNEGGTTITNSSVDKEFVLRTYWITEQQSVLFESLITSPYVLMKLEGVYYQVEVLDTGGTVETDKNKGLIKKQVTVRMSNQTNINV